MRKTITELFGEGVISDDGGLYSLSAYLEWVPDDEEICLDGHFSVEKLEAIVQYIKEKQKEKTCSPKPSA